MVPLSNWLVPVGLLEVDKGSCPAVRLLLKWLPVLILVNWPSLPANSKLTLTGASIGISHTGIASVNGVIRSSGTIHDFIVFLASRVATTEKCISRLEFVTAQRWRAVLHKVLQLLHDCEAQCDDSVS